MVIAIDGPAGAGKSTVARAAAERLGFTYLDSGAMYRAVALRGGDPVAVAREARLELGERVTLDGEDVTEQIREPWVSEAASRVASDPAVREALVEQQRRILTEGDWVAEGRDIGTVVAPDAAVKVFLTADPAERARRRADELRRRGIEVEAEDVHAAIEQRDRLDSTRSAAPLRPADDAVTIDTTGDDADRVIERVAALAERASSKSA
jgi:CMP/dCMP kinase